MRVWGEEAALLERAGADVDELARLEEALATEIAGLGAGAGAVDAHVHLGRDADGHRLEAAGLLADLDRWGIARAVCFAPNDAGPDGQFAAANAAVLEAADAAGGADRALLPGRSLAAGRGRGDGAGRRRRGARAEAPPGGPALPPGGPGNRGRRP